MTQKFLAAGAAIVLALSTIANCYTDASAQGSAEAVKPKHLEHCLQTGKISAVLTGDGTTTSHCDLNLTDTTSGQTSSVELKTICISQKHRKPPPPKEVAQKNGITYKIGSPAPKEIKSIVRAARKLAAEGRYASVPLPLEKRQSTVAQLAVWRELGKNSPNPADKITLTSIKDDLLSKAQVKESDLSAAEKSAVKNRVDLIFEAVELTNKEGETIAQKPEDDSFTGEVIDSEGTDEMVSIPPFTVFECSDPQYQDLMTVSAATIHCPAAGIKSSQR